MNSTVATSFALSAAALLLGSCDRTAEKSEAASATPAMTLPEPPAGKVNCLGINECKGQSACHTKSHACAGQNECKGKGWIAVSRSECENKKGTIL